MADETQTPRSTAIESETAAPTAAKRPLRAKDATRESSALAKGPAKSRGLSDDQKLEKLNHIKGLVASGTTLKDAVNVAGISDQTYYIWKKAIARPTSVAPARSVTGDDEMAEFLQLEEENRSLRKQLSEKLRAENADLRKRLGLP